MTYDQTISYLYQQLPYFSRQGADAYKKDLHNIIALCKALGDPQKQLTTVHIAGTNGKGSVSHMLASVLQEAGYKTGLYTSPHIKEFGERIRINGTMIDRSFVINFVEETKGLCDEIKPSFFELSVAMAFSYFAQQSIDVAVIETGLGGRLDSTNIIHPEVSIITNIGYDHINILGSTIGEIAKEKAGIIKKDVPVVIGELLPETKSLFIAEANEKSAPIYLSEELYSIEYIGQEGELLLCNIRTLSTNIVEKLRLSLTGIYQAKNARTLLCAVDILRKKMTIPEFALHKGVEQVKTNTGIYGRWDIIRNEPRVIIDAAHNADGIAEVLHHLETGYSGSKWHFVLGFVKDKEISRLLSLLPAKANYYFTNAHILRAMPHAELKSNAENAGLQGNSYDDVNEALAAATVNAAPNDVIVICGSFFLLAELKEIISEARSFQDS